MIDPQLKNIRNIGIIAHIDAGKTTLTERFLFYSGKSHRIGNVDDGNTIMDYLDEERARGITIAAAAASFPWNRSGETFLIHLIDTPGHIDFTAEVERSLRVIDGAVVIFSGVEGVEAQSEKVWRQSAHYRVPKIAFINKLDRMGASFERVVRDIRAKFPTIKSVPLQLPVGVESSFSGVIDLVEGRYLTFSGTDGSDAIASEIPAEYQSAVAAAREELLGTVADLSDEIAEYYLESREVPIALLKKEIRRLVIANQLCPLFVGAARRNIGAQPVLDAVIDYLPSPLDCPPCVGTQPKSGEEIRVDVGDDAFCGLVFKVIAGSGADLLYLRTYSGRLKPDMTVINTRTGERCRPKRLLRLYAKNIEPMDDVGPGDIVGAIGLKNTTTGDTLCAVNRPLLLEGVTFPEPVISIAIEPKSAKDKDKLGASLELLCREDPTLRLTRDDNTGQHLLSGMGELHLEINCHRLRNEFHLDARYGAPQVVYRETLKAAAEVVGTFDRTIGDKPYFAEVVFRVEPIGKDGDGIEVLADLKPRSDLPGSWIAAARDALSNGLKTGGNWGYPLIYIRATLLDIRGSSDKTVDNAVAGAVLEGVGKAIRHGTELLEPISRMEIMSPDDTIGEITGYLQARRAIIHGIEPYSDIKRLLCEVPLAEMFGFSKALPKLSGGRAAFNMEPCGYQKISVEDLERAGSQRARHSI